MNITGNTILITGGGSGIGLALAEAFHKAGNQVVIAGRREQLLNEVTSANPGMEALLLDIQEKDDVAAFARQAVESFPALNVVIHNAGIMRSEAVAAGDVIFAVEADKGITEVEALDDGILRIPAGSPIGVEVPVGTTLAFITEAGEEVPALAASPASESPLSAYQPAWNSASAAEAGLSAACAAAIR